MEEQICPIPGFNLAQPCKGAKLELQGMKRKAGVPRERKGVNSALDHCAQAAPFAQNAKPFLREASRRGMAETIGLDRADDG